jgi:glycosyltransferase involved in cell wall biosynthesis
MLPRYLASCDVFVLPSEEEPWGLIVNEAMNAGLPVIVGKDAGCVRDLVRNGDNGFAVEPGNVRELQDRLTEVVDEPTQRHMAERSRAIVHEWGYTQCAQGWRQALSRL